MRRFITGLGTVVLVAALMVGFAPAAGASSGVQVVHPGQSIQAAIDAVGSGGTVWVQPGQYQEHLVITHGVNLIGYGATLTPPAGIAPPSPCSAPDPNVDGICIIGDVSFDPSTGATTGQPIRQRCQDHRPLRQRIRRIRHRADRWQRLDIRRCSFDQQRRIRHRGIRLDRHDRIVQHRETATRKQASTSAIRRRPTPPCSPTPRSGNGNGFFVRDAEHGSIIGNDSHGNCVGILFLADAPGPAGSFNVVGNSIRKNNRACPASDDGPATSGIGVAIVGAHDVSVHFNAITQNTPGGDTPAAGGVVVGIGDGGTPPVDNHVQNNLIVRNQVDIAWDGTGTGNVFKPNLCGSTTPSGLC